MVVTGLFRFPGRSPGNDHALPRVEAAYVLDRGGSYIWGDRRVEFAVVLVIAFEETSVVHYVDAPGAQKREVTPRGQQ